MRKLTPFVIGAGLLAASAASAADLSVRRSQPAAPAFAPTAGFSWMGGYVGLEAGYQWGNARLRLPGIPASASTDPSGFSLGGHMGYRYQFNNNLVAGAELRGFVNFDTGSSMGYAGIANSTRIENKWGGDARLTLGYAMGRFLPYLAGGVALADDKGNTTFVGGSSGFSETRAGWTIGGGLAYAITDNLITRLDYSYSDFGAKTQSTPGVPGGATRVRLDTHALRAGLSYKF
jgi:outer membrane immunogenic protein